MVATLPQKHILALWWFALRAGSTQPWPKPLTDGTLIVTQAKGIYKPEWSQYALSVRQTLNGPYQDKEPHYDAPGEWTYPYFQEGTPPSEHRGEYKVEERDAEFTNRGLVACMNDKIPVGVLRQTKGKPNVQYRVLGLALVESWQDGVFRLRSLPPSNIQEYLNYEGPEQEQLARVRAEVEAKGDLDPSSIADQRNRVLAAIVRRQGQQAFRSALLEAYEGYCVMTGCSATQALEAAHIIPFAGPATNTTANGLLLRADIHTLFDLGLISVSRVDKTIRVSSVLDGTDYAQLSGRRIRDPRDPSDAPSTNALSWHLRESGLSE